MSAPAQATVRDLQLALLALGFDVGRFGADGDFGGDTLKAAYAAVQKLAGVMPIPAPTPAQGVVPAAWMPPAKMLRIVFHWTAGGPHAAAEDRAAYHILIEQDGKLVKGDRSIADNISTADGVYAHHTAGLNSGSIGVSLCGMAGAKEFPFRPGSAPLTRVQWETLPKVMSDLCRRYTIAVRPELVLSHAEVQGRLGVPQAGKWDIARLPFDDSLTGATAIGDAARAATKALL